MCFRNGVKPTELQGLFLNYLEVKKGEIKKKNLVVGVCGTAVMILTLDLNFLVSSMVMRMSYFIFSFLN